MRREIRDEVLRYDGPFVYVDGLILQATRNIATVEVAHHARSDGRSGYSFGKLVSLWSQMATSFSVVPLRFVSLIGALSSIVGFVMAGVVVALKLLHPEWVVGWASMIVTVLILGGIQLLSLGAIGEYVGRVLLTLNGKPQYVVRKTIGRLTARE
jgi:undecaprenyl-phosphate 4-deoxy-4-formamido-L-arabinose transferase